MKRILFFIFFLLQYVVIAMPNSQAEEKTPTVKVFQFYTRIERGQKITPDMYRLVQINRSDLPVDAILENEEYKIKNAYANRLISKDIPLVIQDVSSTIPDMRDSLRDLFRVQSILVKDSESVSRLKSGDRVNVNWELHENGRKKTATPLIRFAKILSITKTPPLANKLESESNFSVSLAITIKQYEYLNEYFKLIHDHGNFSLQPVEINNISNKLIVPPTNIDDPIIFKEQKLNQR